VGVSPASLFSQGPIGLISRSGTLTHEVACNLTDRGIGQSTCVCIGGDITKTLNFTDVLELFRDDEQTSAVIMIGEVGGAGEELAARFIETHGYPKPVVAYIAGRNTPEGKKMGHAGAIINGNLGMAESKISSLRSAGVRVADRLEDILTLLESTGKN
jgi:succinyl-CoA synthetase alpha subunit